MSEHIQIKESQKKVVSLKAHSFLVFWFVESGLCKKKLFNSAGINMPGSLTGWVG
jgi:hypothetical protein